VVWKLLDSISRVYDTDDCRAVMTYVKVTGISGPAEELSAPREGLCIELPVALQLQSSSFILCNYSY